MVDVSERYGTTGVAVFTRRSPGPDCNWSRPGDAATGIPPSDRVHCNITVTRYAVILL